MELTHKIESNELDFNKLLQFAKRFWVILLFSASFGGAMGILVKSQFPKYKVAATFFVSDKSNGLLQSIISDLSGIGASPVFGKVGPADAYEKRYKADAFFDLVSKKLLSSTEPSIMDLVAKSREEYLSANQRRAENGDPQVTFEYWFANSLRAALKIEATDSNIVTIQGTFAEKSWAVAATNQVAAIAISFAINGEVVDLIKARSYIIEKIRDSEILSKSYLDQILSLQLGNRYAGASAVPNTTSYDQALAGLRERYAESKLKHDENLKLIEAYGGREETEGLSNRTLISSLLVENQVLVSRMSSIAKEISSRNREKLEFINVVNTVGSIIKQLELESEKLKKFQELTTKIDFMEMSTQNRFLTVEHALPENVAPRIKTVVAAFIGAILALGLMLTVLFVYDFAFPKILSSASYAEFPGLFLGSLPSFNKSSGAGVTDIKQFVLPPSHFSNKAVRSFKGLRRSLVNHLSTPKFTRDAEVGKVISITSPMAASGKTTISTNLAWSLVQAGKKVLLVDSDPYNPRATLRFGLSNASGLFESLQSDSEKLDANIQVYTDPSNSELELDIIPIGASEISFETLKNERWIQFFHQLKLRYEYIIVDTPPVLETFDCGDLFANSDLVLIVGVYGKTRVSTLQQAIATLPQSAGMSLAYILNKVPEGILGTSNANSENYYYFNKLKSKLPKINDAA